MDSGSTRCSRYETGEAGQEEQHVLQQHDHVHQQQERGQRQHHVGHEGESENFFSFG